MTIIIRPASSLHTQLNVHQWGSASLTIDAARHEARNRSMSSVQLESRCQHAQICTFEWLLLDCSITPSCGYHQNEPSAVEKTVPRKRQAENDLKFKKSVVTPARQDLKDTLAPNIVDPCPVGFVDRLAKLLKIRIFACAQTYKDHQKPPWTSSSCDGCRTHSQRRHHGVHNSGQRSNVKHVKTNMWRSVVMLGTT